MLRLGAGPRAGSRQLSAPGKAASAMNRLRHTLHARQSPCALGTAPGRRPCTTARAGAAAVAVTNAVAGRRLALEVVAGRRAAKIANRKGKADAKKSKLYGRIGKKIIQIVKSGGPDPVSNAALDLIMRQAKEAGVPRDIIDRNVKRATDGKQADFSDVTYEAYGPGGTGFIVECLTDNLNRSASEVKSTITKAGCKVADPGSVLFNFSRCGAITIDGAEEDALFEACMEVGGDDVAPCPEDEDGNPSTSYKVFTPVEAFGSASSRLKELGFRVDAESSELVYRATTPVEVDDDAFAKCEALIEKLLDLDDVDAVYTNCDGLQV